MNGRAVFSGMSDLEARVRTDHPRRAIRSIVNAVQRDLAPDFGALCSKIGRPSIAPEKLIRAMLLQAFHSVRSEREVMEWLDKDLLFRWFASLTIDDPVWNASSKARSWPSSGQRSRAAAHQWPLPLTAGLD
jgi:transposase